MSPISALFRALVDDAAVFPPGNLPLPEAVSAHRAHRSAWYADLVGPLLCPASRIAELDSLLAHDGNPLGVGVIVDTGTGGVLEGVDSVARDERLTLRCVEVPLRGEPLADNARRAVAALDAALGGSDDDEPGYVEVPRSSGWRAALDVIADSGYRAKLRTGGAAAEAYPSEQELAQFILGCLDRGVAFKLTAGLHQAVRHSTDAGTEEHGFLNVITAVAAALDGADAADLAARLAARESDVVAATIKDLRPERAAGVRRWFASYGSCSIAEPLTDLVALGLVERPDNVGA